MVGVGGGVLNETGLFPKVRLRESKKKEKKNLSARQKPPRQSLQGPARIQPKVGAHICLDALFMSEISSLNPIMLAAISSRCAPSPTLPPSNCARLRRSLRRPYLKSKQRRCDLGPRRRLRGYKSGAKVFCSSVIRLCVYIYLLRMMTAELQRHRPTTIPVTVCFRSAIRGHRLIDSSGC